MRTLALVLVLALGVAGALVLLDRPWGGGEGVGRAAPVGPAVAEAEVPAGSWAGSTPRSDPAAPREGVAGAVHEPVLEDGVAAGEQPDTLLVRVVGPGGEPWLGARVLVIEAGRIVEDAQASGGAVELARPRGPAEALALDAAAGVARAAIGAGERELVLALDPPAAVAGRVHIRGAPPEEPVELALETDLARAPAGLPSPARRVWEELARGGSRRASDDQGRFRFPVPRDWSGRLRLPPPTLRFAGEGGALTLAGPREDLLLELASVPAIRGRVVEAGGGAPVPGSSVFAFHEGDVMRGSSHRADVEGRFEVTFDPEGTRAVMLDLHGPDQQGSRRVRVEPVPREGVDLGDVELASGPELAVRVVDAAGEPVPGAMVGWGTGGAGLAADGEGRALLRRGENPSTLVSAWAPGFQVAVLQVARDERGPVELVLERCASLVLDLRTVDGGPLPHHLALRIVGDPAAFDKDGTAADARLLRLSNVLMFSSNTEAGSMVLRLQPAEPGELRVDCIEPGYPLAVALVDAMGETLVELGQVALLPAEERRLEAEIDTLPRLVTVRVLDPSGSPLPGARVTLVGPSGRTAMSTRADGQAAVQGIHVGRVDVWITAEGHAPALLSSVELPEGGAELEVALGPGRSLTVEVVDAEGQPLAGAEVQATLELADGRHERVGEGTPLAPGHLRLDLLPLQPVLVRATLGPHESTASAPPAAEDLRIEIPQ